MCGWWESAPVKRNRAVLEKDGVHFVGPNDGEKMACRGIWAGPRMAEAALEIVTAIEQILSAPGYYLTRYESSGHGWPDGASRSIRYTPFSPINSSGKQGYAIGSGAGQPQRPEQVP